MNENNPNIALKQGFFRAPISRAENALETALGVKRITPNSYFSATFLNYLKQFVIMFLIFLPILGISGVILALIVSNTSDLGVIILSTFLCLFLALFGLSIFITMLEKWRAAHTVINGKNLVYTGKIGKIYGKICIWFLLTIITVGVFALFLPLVVRRYIINLTYFVGEEHLQSHFNGKISDYIFLNLFSFFMCLTLILIPFAFAMKESFYVNNTYYSDQKMKFTGTGAAYLSKGVVWLTLTVFTLGIFTFLYYIRSQHFIVSNTSIDDTEQPELIKNYQSRQFQQQQKQQNFESGQFQQQTRQPQQQNFPNGNFQQQQQQNSPNGNFQQQQQQNSPNGNFQQQQQPQQQNPYSKQNIPPYQK